jgi:hypothetical protein
MSERSTKIDQSGETITKGETCQEILLGEAEPNTNLKEAISLLKCSKRRRACKAFQTGEQCEQRCGARNACRLFRNNEYTDVQQLKGKIL